MKRLNGRSTIRPWAIVTDPSGKMGPRDRQVTAPNTERILEDRTFLWTHFFGCARIARSYPLSDILSLVLMPYFCARKPFVRPFSVPNFNGTCAAKRFIS